MNNKKMFLSFVPWIAFSVLAERHGATAACLAATALSVFFAVKNNASGDGLKLVDLTGIITFGVMTVAAATGGTATDAHVIDFGRGLAALVLGVVMLVSVLFVPFTEQYARESVPREYWHSPTFRAINRRVSALWGAAIVVMGLGHLLAGHLAPTSAAHVGARPVDLFFNWVLPVLLVLGATKRTDAIVAAASSDSHLDQASR